MRTLQEKYNAIQEGKFTKDQFLRDARLAQPNLVTRFNGYDDAVQILKNRGMISEVEYSRVLELPDGDYFAIDSDWEDTYKGHNGLFFTIDGNNIYDKDGESIQSSPREFVSQFKPEEILKVEAKLTEDFTEYSNDALTDMIINLSRYEGNEEDIRKVKQELERRKGQLKEATQLKTTKKGLADYRYKPTNDMDKYPYEQILRGLRVELETMGIEGTPTAEEYQKALAKVLKNLQKDEIYYTNQVAGVKANKKRTDLMIDATPKNEVDKENGLQKAQLKEAFKKIIKNILSEGNEFGEGEEVYEMYGDSDGDYEHDKDTAAQAEMLYDKGQELFNQGKAKQAEALRQQALKTASWLGWGEEDLPPYTQDDEIDYDDENFSDPFIDGDLEEATDTEADKNMVRKFMTMYETEPSKFEKLHKQAQVQAKTTKDIKFKHLLSLLDRAKAGALQSLANQDKFEADREGMDEGYEDKKVKTAKQNGDKSYSVEYEDGTKKTISVSHDDWDNINAKFGKTEQDVFESVSLKDILD